MKKLNLIIFICFCFLKIINCNDQVNIYKNNDILYSFNYSKEISFEDEDFRLKNMYILKSINGKDTYIQVPINKNTNLNNIYTVNTYSLKISEYTEDTRIKPPANNKEIILNKLKNKDNNIFFKEINKSRKFYVVDNNIIGEEMIGNNAEYHYSVTLYIVKGEYLIVIVLNYYDSFSNMQKMYPDLFKKGENEETVWKDKKIFEKIMNGEKNTPIELIKLYQYFNEIKKSIKLN